MCLVLLISGKQFCQVFDDIGFCVGNHRTAIAVLFIVCHQFFVPRHLGKQGLLLLRQGLTFTDRQEQRSGKSDRHQRGKTTALSNGPYAGKNQVGFEF